MMQTTTKTRIASGLLAAAMVGSASAAMVTYEIDPSHTYPTTFNRADFGLTVGNDYGFDMGVTLRIQIEVIASEKQP